jgi:hypothetical protein
VNSEWLVIGAISSVPLILGLLSASIDLADLRTRRRGRVAGQPSQPEQKADALLNEWLRPEQRATLERHGYFDVRGSHTGKCYRIRRGRNMNIDELGKNGGQVATWCFGPVAYLPLGDVMLTQKLALETDEQATLAVANRLRRRC